MKNLLLFTMLCSTLSTTGQITLEYNYNYQYHSGGVSIIQIEDDGHKYMAFDTLAKAIDLYHINHSHWRTIKLPTSSTIRYYGAHTIYRRLFATDNDIEFIAYGNDIATGEPVTQILNEHGQILKTFQNTTIVNVFSIGESYKLRAYYYANAPAHTEIYSLPGKLTGLQKPGKGEQPELELYPNPMGEAATLSYTLPAGVQRGQVDIYNATGAHLRSYQVTNQFSTIIIHRGELPPGNYVYKVSAQGMQPAANVFVIR